MKNINKSILSILFVGIFMVFTSSNISASDTIEQCTSCDFGDAPESYGPGGIYSRQQYTLNNMMDDHYALSTEDAPKYSDDATGDNFDEDAQQIAEESGWIGSQPENLSYYVTDDSFVVSFYISESSNGMYSNGTLSMWLDADQDGKFNSDEAVILTHDDLEFTEIKDLAGFGYNYIKKYIVTATFDMTDINADIEDNYESSFTTFMRFRTFSDEFVPEPSDAATNFFTEIAPSTGDPVQGETEDYQVNVILDNDVQVCSQATGSNETLQFDSAEVTNDKKTITYKGVTLYNGDVVDVVVNSSENQDIIFNGMETSKSAGEISDFLIIQNDNDVPLDGTPLENDIDINIYETGTTTEYPLALTFQLSGIDYGGYWGIDENENDYITLGNYIESDGQGNYSFGDEAGTSVWIAGAVAYSQSVIYSSNSELANYNIDTSTKEPVNNMTTSELNRLVTISTTSYEENMDLDDCLEEFDLEATSNGFTDDDTTRTDDVQGVSYFDDLTIESSAVTYYNYPNDDYLGYEITIPSKYVWEDLIDNIVVYSADDSTQLNYDDSGYSIVDPQYISYTYNSGVLDIHINDTYPGFDDLVDNNNQFKFEVSGFSLKDVPTQSTISTEEFLTKAYVHTTKDGEEEIFTNDINPVNVTDEVTEVFFDAEDIRISANVAKEIDEDTLLDLIEYEFFSHEDDVNISFNQDELAAIIQAGIDNMDITLPLTLYLSDGQETTINVEIYAEDETEIDISTPTITEEDDQEIQETGYNYIITPSLVILMVIVIAFVLKNKIMQ